MDEQDDDPRARPARLAVLTEQFLRREQAEDEALAWAQLEQEQAGQAAPAPRRPGRFPGRARGRLLPVGAAVGVVILAVVFALLQLHGTSRALADPARGAAAAERERTFRFSSRSELLFADGRSRLSLAQGEVDLAIPAFRVRVDSGPGSSGFERVVFPGAVYARPLTPAAARPWLGAHLSPTAQITPRAASGEGIGDPLGLLALLSKSHGARLVGTERVAGEIARHYRLHSTLGAFLLLERRHALTRIAAIPVTIDVWQDDANRVLRATRDFALGGPRRERLNVETDFFAYGQPTAISVPAGVALIGSQRLSPLAGDPLASGALSALTFGAEHPATAAHSPAQKRRRRRGQTSQQAGGPTP